MITLMEYNDAIKSLESEAQFICSNNTVVQWDSPDINQPTDAEITAEATRLKGVYDGLAYSRTRKTAYDLLNQDEMRFDDLVNSTTTWHDAIVAIKVANPKP